MRILVVEDEPALSSAIAEFLRSDFYAVDVARTGAAASELMDVNPYDLVLLDWSIPPPSGLELLKAWRGAGISTPVLMLTGNDDAEQKVAGLDTGADDYLTKPFVFAELSARVRSLLRRRNKDLNARLAAGDLEMDRATREVTLNGLQLELRPKEFAILEYLLVRIDQVVSRTELVEHVWDDSFDAMSNVVDVTVHRLRRKIDGDQPGALLHTLKGVGYLLKSQRS